MTGAEPLGVLLIEDDDDDALIVSHLLADAGADVALRRCRTLGESLTVLPDGIACVLLDLRLPDADGIEALRRLRRTAPGTAIIVLTGLSEEAAGPAAVAAGAQDYLVKGYVDGALLHRAIRYAIGRRNAEDALAQLRVAEVRAAETRRLERGLVPHPLVRGDEVWVASSYLPGRRRALIGGDFFDVVAVKDRAVHAIIGDVSGRGPDEAALGATLRIAWRALTLSDTPPAEVLGILQRVLEAERQDAGTFATVCTLCLQPGDATLHMRRAGHPAPMLLDERAQPLPLEGGGPPIGLFPDTCDWSDRSFPLPPDWSVLLYTDGVTEAGDGAGGLLGETGLQEIVDDLVADPDWREAPPRLVEGIVEEARRRHGEPFADDVALLAIGAL